ncbi:MAG: hypothetical protein HPY44_17505 [Armatimonadetes bacterium]|nr:hypothetical protein [Armatimonadota bacterium]
MCTGAAIIILILSGLLPAAADDLATATETFNAHVEQYLYCNIADDTITLTPVEGESPDLWQGSAAFATRSNVPFQITHGWQSWSLPSPGFSGTTSISTASSFGSDGYIAPGDRYKTGFITIAVTAEGTAPSYPLASGGANDTAAVGKLESDSSTTPVGTVQLTLSVLF